MEYKQYVELKKRVEMRMFWPGGALKSYSREECHQALDLCGEQKKTHTYRHILGLT